MLRSVTYCSGAEEIAGLLSREDGLQTILSEYETFAAAYQENPDIMRFRFYRPLALQAQLADLQREPLHFTAAEGYDPQRRFFISGDEIDHLLRGGKRRTGLPIRTRYSCLMGCRSPDV